MYSYIGRYIHTYSQSALYVYQPRDSSNIPAIRKLFDNNNGIVTTSVGDEIEVKFLFDTVYGAKRAFATYYDIELPNGDRLDIEWTGYTNT